MLAYDGESINNMEQFILIVAHATPGVHKLTLRRGDAVIVREVPAGKIGVNIANVRAESKLPNATVSSDADQLPSNKRRTRK